jgi:L-lactate dehydrogenase complex protein LldF
MAAFATAMTRPALYRTAARALRMAPCVADNEILPVVKEWTRSRQGLRASPKSFRELWERGIE